MNATGSGIDRNETDEELVVRARAGDAGAISRLVSRYREILIGFCYRYLGDFHAAEDTAQEILGSIVAGRWPAGVFRPWVYRLARNRCLDQLRRRNDGRIGAESQIGAANLLSPLTGPRTALSRSERHRHLAEHMSSLPEEHHEVLMLRYFDELARRDIAEVLGLSEAAVKHRLNEARRELRRRVTERKASGS